MVGRKTAPEALITAALILHRNPTDDIPDLPANAKPTFPKPSELVAEAKKLKIDKATAGLIDWAEGELKVKERGSAGIRSFGGGAKQTVTIPFRAGELATVTVIATHLVKSNPLAGAYHRPAKFTITVEGPGAPKTVTRTGGGSTAFMVPLPKGVAKGKPVPYKVTVAVEGRSPHFTAHTN